MKNAREVILAALVLSVAAACGPGPSTTDTPDKSGVQSTRAPLVATDLSTAIAGRYIVVLKDGMAQQQTIGALALTPGVTITNIYTVIPAFAAALTSEAVAALQAEPSVKYVAADQVVTINTIQWNPRYGLDRIDQRQGTNRQYDDFRYTGAGVHVYIIDTGLRTTHQEFTGRVGEGYSTVAGGIQDCNGHGTHVASSAAGTQYGVAKGATVHPVRVLDCSGSGTFSGVIAGIDWVAKNAIRPAVANMSLGGGVYQPVDDAVTALVAAGVPTAVAAGNTSEDACTTSPARTPAAVTVGATNLGDEGRAVFSDYGTCIDVFAPGVRVIGAWSTSDTATNTISGTSMATPQVTGALALYMQRYPALAAANASADLVAAATQNVVVNPGAGSPNRFLFTDFGTPTANSCYGHCGGQAPSFQCACDASCTYFSDCCADFTPLCK